MGRAKGAGGRGAHQMFSAWSLLTKSAPSRTMYGMVSTPNTVRMAAMVTK